MRARKLPSPFLKELLKQVEDRCNIDINRTHLIISGDVQGSNYSGSHSLSQKCNSVSQSDMEQAEDDAFRHFDLDENRISLMHQLQHYTLDGEICHELPHGKSCKKISAYYHGIHANTKHIQSSLRCIQKMMIDVQAMLFSPVAASLCAIDQADKQTGALIIDMGAETTNYVHYHNGSISASGSIALGGSDITHVIQTSCGTPEEVSETLKHRNELASNQPINHIEFSFVSNTQAYSSDKMRARIVRKIIHSSLCALFEQVHQQLTKDQANLSATKIFLAGGASRVHGCEQAAEGTFKLPCRLLTAEDYPGCPTKLWKPEYASILGLLQYAHLMPM